MTSTKDAAVGEWWTAEFDNFSVSPHYYADIAKQIGGQTAHDLIQGEPEAQRKAKFCQMNAGHEVCIGTGSHMVSKVIIKTSK